MEETVSDRKPEHFSRGYLIGLVPVLCISVFPGLFLYAQNAFICPLAEVLPFACLTAGVGLVCYTVLYFLFGRRMDAAALSAVVCMILFSYFYLLCALAERLTGSDRNLYGLLIACIMAAAALIPLYLLRKRPVLRVVRIGVTVFLIVMVLINVVSAVPNAVKRIRIKSELKMPAVQSDVYQPDIYYIILDEYAEANTMRDYFLTDLSPLYAFLKERGFAISDTSYNATFGTQWNIANVLSLSDETVRADTDEETVMQALADARIYAVLSSIGYHSYAMPSEQGIFYCESVREFADKELAGATLSGKTPGKILLERSLLRPLAWRVPDFTWESTVASAMLDYLSDASSYVSGGNRALLCHLLSPHPPYSHEADGTIKPRQEWYDYDDATEPALYLAQHTYVTDRLYDVVSAMLKADPDCVIILQSDHNFRFTDARYLPAGRGIPQDELRHIFNAVYFRGEPIDIEGLTGPQTLRLVLEKLGAQLGD